MTIYWRHRREANLGVVPSTEHATATIHHEARNEVGAGLWIAIFTIFNGSNDCRIETSYHNALFITALAPAAIIVMSW
jgi:hypothetical protein